MEHRFTDVEDGTSAGAWWAPSAVLPELAWRYDARAQLLIISSRTGTTTEHRLSGTRLMNEEARHTFLPSLVLHISRRVSQSRD